jgi:hypothetical protein
VLEAADRATAGDAGASSSHPAVKLRGRLRSSGRTPVRSIDEVVQELQLPKARWVLPACYHAVLHECCRSVAEVSTLVAWMHYTLWASTRQQMRARHTVLSLDIHLIPVTW